ncbi:MAG: MOSC domain-containing protein [Vicinamibacterales bacterium]
MKIVSINVGRPRQIPWQGQLVLTSIFKSPVTGRVRVRPHNLDGDEQSDLTVHGGVNKAVYVYPSEHYAFWKRVLPDADLGWGNFGENLTTEGLLEDRVRIGDTLRIGSAEFIVTQPRLPCFKLGIRFNRADMVKRFHLSGRSGFYLSIAREGEVGADDEVAHVAGSEDSISVAAIFRLYTADDADRQLMQRATELPALSPSWREHFRKRLAE